MRISTLLLAPVMLVAAACGGSGGSSPETSADKNSTPVARPLPSVSDVLSMVYDNSYSVPDGFFVDDRASTPSSYTMHHVLDESGAFERCTNDFQQALAWEDTDNASRAVQGRFVGSVETDRYFEFARELSYEASIGNINDITSPGFGRVYKCSNTVRDGVDRSQHDGYAGQINARPLTDETVRVFTEYLWQFTFFPTARKKVLESYGEYDANSIERNLLLGFALSGGAQGCDRIEVVRWTFSADRISGETSKTWQLVDSFDARLVNGSPELCN